MNSTAKTVDAYVAALPDDRKAIVKSVLKTVRDNLPKGYEEAMTWGMPTWEVPLKDYPDTYNKKPLMYVALASQKNHMALYLMGSYGNPALDNAFRVDYKATGKKLDMGKGCVRFKKLEDLPLEVISKYIAAVPMEDFIAHAKAVSKR
jgi:uncharacterized protein YdhG (YjbR/CyaY superfamily)